MAERHGDTFSMSRGNGPLTCSTVFRGRNVTTGYKFSWREARIFLLLLIKKSRHMNFSEQLKLFVENVDPATAGEMLRAEVVVVGKFQITRTINSD